MGDTHTHTRTTELDRLVGGNLCTTIASTHKYSAAMQGPSVHGGTKGLPKHIVYVAMVSLCAFIVLNVLALTSVMNKSLLTNKLIITIDYAYEVHIRGNDAIQSCEVMDA